VAGRHRQSAHRRLSGLAPVLYRLARVAHRSARALQLAAGLLQLGSTPRRHPHSVHTHTHTHTHFFHLSIFSSVFVMVVCCVACRGGCSIVKVLKKWIDDTWLRFTVDERLIATFEAWAQTASNFSVKDKGWIDHLLNSMVRPSIARLLLSGLTVCCTLCVFDVLTVMHVCACRRSWRRIGDVRRSRRSRRHRPSSRRVYSISSSTVFLHFV
jgi:hypothetical protein